MPTDPFISAPAGLVFSPAPVALMFPRRLCPATSTIHSTEADQPWRKRRELPPRFNRSCEGGPKIPAPVESADGEALRGSILLPRRRRPCRQATGGAFLMLASASPPAAWPLPPPGGLLRAARRQVERPRPDFS